MPFNTTGIQTTHGTTDVLNIYVERRRDPRFHRSQAAALVTAASSALRGSSLKNCILEHGALPFSLGEEVLEMLRSEIGVIITSR